VTGARRGELCALRWSDVDWQRRTLRIARSLTAVRGQTTEGPSKTHLRRDIDPYVLSSSADGSLPMLPDRLTDNYRNLTKKLGISTHLHELRHFSATEGIGAGIDVRTVAGRLGHADATTTLRIYAHALEARDRELAGVLDSAVFGTRPSGKPQPRDDLLRVNRSAAVAHRGALGRRQGPRGCGTARPVGHGPAG
jgi:integrase